MVFEEISGSSSVFWKNVLQLLSTNIALENPQFSWCLPEKILIFQGYFSFPEGNSVPTSISWKARPGSIAAHLIYSG